jgi:hypothetical protein
VLRRLGKINKKGGSASKRPFSSSQAVLKICASPMCRPEASYVSPRAYFFVTPSPFFVAPSLFCPPEHIFLSPRAYFLSPRAYFLSPRAYFFVAPSGSEGSLSAYAPREDTKGSVPRDDGWAVHPSPFLSPRALFFVAPRRKTRGLLEDVVPNEVRRDAVPSEARDALLSPGRTKKDARQDGVGNFFEQPLPHLDYFKPYV